MATNEVEIVIFFILPITQFFHLLYLLYLRRVQIKFDLFTIFENRSIFAESYWNPVHFHTHLNNGFVCYELKQPL